MKKYIVLLMLCLSPSISFSEVHFNGMNYEFILDLPDVKEAILLFGFDGYQKRYFAYKDPQNEGKFVLNLDTQKIGKSIKPGKYFYRVIADGIMTFDPTNPMTEIIPTVGKISYFTVKEQYLDNLSGPVRIDDLTYRFFYHTSAYNKVPEEIILTGDFNYWNLYDHVLKQSSENPNTWYIDVSFDHPQNIQYMFIVDGQWLSDINNSDVVTNYVGQNVSQFKIS